MYSSLLLAAGLASAAHAFTQPGAQTWGPLLTPDTSDPVTQGKDFTITWDPESHPTDGVTVSLVLCHGPGSNCVLSDTAIAEGIPAAQKSYDWSVPCDLAPGTQSTSTGYGMLIIVDGTGEFQYSTQFSVLANSDCASSGSTSSSSGSSGTWSSSSSASATLTTSTVSGHSSIVIGPPAYQTGSSSIWGSAGNLSITATPTGSNWATLPGTTVIASTSGSVTYTYGGATYPSGTSAAGSTVAAGTTGVAATAGGPAASASTFAGGAAQLGSSIAGMVIAGAVAVFAL